MILLMLFRWFMLFLLFNRTFGLNYEIKSKCLSEKSSSLTINCPTNKITRILKAFYGYSWSGDCHFIEKDCIVDVPNEDLSCLGEGCSVKIIESPIILQECWNLMASYIQIDYECIPVEDLQNMCNIHESERPVGYIVTPNYPSFLDNDLSCPCTLSAPKGYTLSIEVLDFRLPGCSQAGLTLWSDSSTYTHCLSISSGILPGSESQNISMRLHSENKKINAGFLLKYFTHPPSNETKIKFVCYGSLTNWNIKNSTHKTIVTEAANTDAEEIEVAEFNSHNGVFKNKKKNNLLTTSGFFIRKSKIELESSQDNLKEDESKEIHETTAMKSKDRPKDWTVVIISIIASVIFLLVLINALIWFIFSIKREDENSSQKMPKTTVGNEQFFPPCSDFYKVGFQNEEPNDIYSANSINGLYNTGTTANFLSRQKIWNKYHPYSNGNPEISNQADGLEPYKEFYNLTEHYVPNGMFESEFIIKQKNGKEPVDHHENHIYSISEQEKLKGRAISPNSRLKYDYPNESYAGTDKYFKANSNIYECHDAHADSDYSVIGKMPSFNFNGFKNKLVMNNHPNKSNVPGNNPKINFHQSYHPASWLNGF